MTESLRSATALGRRPSPRRVAGWVVRAPVSVLLLASAGGLATRNAWFRGLESVVAGPVVRFCTSSVVMVRPATDTVFLGLYTPRVYGLTITPECTSALPIAALLALAGAVALPGRFRLPRIGVALLVAAGGMFAVNQLRIVMIAWAAHTWGAAGYGWTHATVGSLLILVGIAAAMVAFFVICGGGTPSAPTPPRTPKGR
ncbi:exosortase/archaeosortase family protein [Streptacidiphilus sp. MAP12-20]|uniref:exosortase/archaeosortase family protein n=1 Tax=Streptacidiphilus sp. MAP12-20 TaxID=3156299 RepID=UPI003512DD2B